MRIYNTRRCENSHSFDVAKEGYINLLLPQHKNSRDPGDSKEMIAARQKFHAKEFYKPLAGEIAKDLGRNTSLLDLGCGEGSYTTWLLESVPTLEYYGVDISVQGIRKAAKSCADATFLVASNWHIPIVDQSVDTALTIFAPVDQAQLQRVTKPDGHWINVTPGTNHLKEFRAALYDEVSDIDKQAHFEGWQVTSRRKLTALMNLAQEDIRNLINMTPYAWQANRELLAVLQAKKTMSVTYDFVISVLIKNPSSSSSASGSF